VLASNLIGTALNSFSYDSAIVTFISPWNGPTTTGAPDTFSRWIHAHAGVTAACMPVIRLPQVR
jgi:hypothetical protein